MTVSSAGPFRAGVRRVVTGHDATGKAIVLFDTATPHRKTPPGANTVSHGIWSTDRVPALAGDALDHWDEAFGISPPTGGTVFKVVDFPPTPAPGPDADVAALQRYLGPDHYARRAHPPRHPAMHRTHSVDYAIVLSGEICMMLDDSEIVLRTGDVVVQQATNHAWINRSDTICRMAFVQIDAVDPLR
jgi:mannose-6-phosphate isomerase-like protein (cupin superfamily)